MPGGQLHMNWRAYLADKYESVNCVVHALVSQM